MEKNIAHNIFYQLTCFIFSKKDGAALLNLRKVDKIICKDFSSHFLKESITHAQYTHTSQQTS